jgi:hypothetical protein
MRQIYTDLRLFFKGERTAEQQKEREARRVMTV